jgi:hypothetical protein
MGHFYACASCARYVTEADEACPFCGASRDERCQAAPPRPPRMSRARWLAYGSTIAAVGCSGGGTAGGAGQDATAPREAAAVELEAGREDTASPHDASPPGEGGGGTDGDVSAEGDVAGDGQIAEAGADCGGSDLGGFAPAQGSFVCLQAPYSLSLGNSAYSDASLICDRATQYCVLYSTGGACESLSDTCSARYYLEPKPGACDGGVLRCECLTGCFAPPSASMVALCMDDEAGGVTIACHSCYGAPPARLERLAA